MSESYLCYGCENIFTETNDLAFICNCHHKDNPKYRAICRQCVASKNLVFIPKNHNLSKIHQYQDGASSGKCICCPSIEEFLAIPKNIRYDN